MFCANQGIMRQFDELRFVPGGSNKNVARKSHHPRDDSPLDSRSASIRAA